MRILGYTSPARGHLAPMAGPLLELAARGHDVRIHTLAAGVDVARGAGLDALPIDPAIERIELDDHESKFAAAAAKRTYQRWAERSLIEIDDFRAAVADWQPDVSLVDTTTLGAAATAEADGLDWVESIPFLLEDPAPGQPPFGFGLAPATGAAGRMRDAFFRAILQAFDRQSRLPAINTARSAVGLRDLAPGETRHRAPRALYHTAPPFEFERELPAGVVAVGPAHWDPATGAVPELPGDDRPLVLVACSSEFQDDSSIAKTALEALAGSYRLIVTTAGIDPESLPAGGDAIVTRYLPHSQILDRCDLVICHGGMGITQKALLHGVPVCVVPWGRDQRDVAVRVVTSDSGTELARRRLNVHSLRRAVDTALGKRRGAEVVQAGYIAAGGDAAAADVILGHAENGRAARKSAAGAQAEGRAQFSRR